MRTASSLSVYGMIVRTGPKISSRAMVWELSTSAKTVGSTNHPASGPPAVRRPDEAGALSLALRDVALDPVSMPRAHQRTHLGRFVEGVTHGEGCGHSGDTSTTSS